jgi:glutathione synthase/RimK-type ligase-like ATP-grasp enzyme
LVTPGDERDGLWCIPQTVRIAFLTSSKFAQLYEDDRLAADELRRRRHSVAPLVWTEADLAALDRFDVVVMRSPWDWFDHRSRFRAFLELLRTTRARVVNTAEQMLEFADKTYLSRLQARGVAVVPTEQLSAAQLHRVPQLLAQHSWTRAVLKPAFTANAVGARRFDATEAPRVLAELVNPADSEPWLLQPFVPSIAQGELSFVFFGGEFSHAVRKRPLPHDWRVQHEYGGLSEPHAPASEEISEATQLLRLSAPGSVYARVDAVEWQGRLHLMELEVVEPELFFRHEPRAPGRFADALTSPFAQSAAR